MCGGVEVWRCGGVEVWQKRVWEYGVGVWESVESGSVVGEDCGAGLGCQCCGGTDHSNEVNNLIGI